MSSKSPRTFRPFRSNYHPSDRKFRWCRMQRKRVEAAVMAVGKVCSLNKMFKWKCIQASHIHQLTGSKLCFKRQGRHLPNGKPPVPLFISLGTGPLSAAPQQTWSLWRDDDTPLLRNLSWELAGFWGKCAVSQRSMKGSKVFRSRQWRQYSMRFRDVPWVIQNH